MIDNLPIQGVSTPTKNHGTLKTVTDDNFENFDNEHEYVLRNREKARQAKYGLTWCGTCDREMVGDLGKCPNCGKYHKRSKIWYGPQGLP